MLFVIWQFIHTDMPIGLVQSTYKMFTVPFAPSVPESLKNIPQKYNLIIRLWSHAFYHLLESLRHAARPPTSSLVALEYLQVSAMRRRAHSNY